MKSWMIKLGKAIETLKRDGFLNGGKKIFNFLLSYFRLRKKLSGGEILFITDGVGDSALYRSHHVSEELNLHGFKSFVTISESPYLLEYAETFQIFIFQKVSDSEKIKKFIEEIKKQGKEIIFETDDLIFDRKYFENIEHLKEANVLEKKQYEKGRGEEILNDPYVKVCTTSTNYLAEKLRERGKKVFVVPNKLSVKDVETVEKIIQLKVHKVEKSIKLGYFSGTIGHNKDFAVASDALEKIMEKYPNVELLIVGPLDVENKFLEKFRSRIKQLPYALREKHFDNISQADINLAPLEINNPFCQAKSELKFFEAGVLKVPTVASATETFREAISDGLDGFAVRDSGGWEEGLERLILEPNLRQEMGKKAREKAISRYFTQNAENTEYYDYLRSKL